MVQLTDNLDATKLQACLSLIKDERVEYVAFDYEGDPNSKGEIVVEFKFYYPQLEGTNYEYISVHTSQTYEDFVNEMLSKRPNFSDGRALEVVIGNGRSFDDVLEYIEGHYDELASDFVDVMAGQARALQALLSSQGE